jgi:hypothetical protein
MRETIIKDSCFIKHNMLTVYERLFLSVSQFVTQTRKMKELIHDNSKWEVALGGRLDDHCHKTGAITFINKQTHSDTYIFVL